MKENAIMLEYEKYGSVDAVEIYDISGRKLFDVRENISFNTWIPVNLSNGNLYLVRITSAGRSTTLKAIPTSN